MPTEPSFTKSVSLIPFLLLLVVVVVALLVAVVVQSAVLVVVAAQSAVVVAPSVVLVAVVALIVAFVQSAVLVVVAQPVFLFVQLLHLSLHGRLLCLMCFPHVVFLHWSSFHLNRKRTLGSRTIRENFTPHLEHRKSFSYPHHLSAKWFSTPPRSLFE